jgi:hypothetical protein
MRPNAERPRVYGAVHLKTCALVVSGALPHSPQRRPPALAEIRREGHNEGDNHQLEIVDAVFVGNQTGIKLGEGTRLKVALVVDHCGSSARGSCSMSVLNPSARSEATCGSLRS